MCRRPIVLLLSIMMSTTLMSPALAVSVGEGTDKYSSTSVAQQSRIETENIQSSGTIAKSDYLQTGVSPNEIKYNSDIPAGYEFHGSRVSGGGFPVNVTNPELGVVIDSDAPRRVMKATVIRSINNACAADLYQPKIEDLPWLKSKIVKDLGFSALYTGEWNPDNVMSNDEETFPHDPERVEAGEYYTPTRANKILGADALVVNENYDTSGYTCTSLKSSSEINLRDAITIAYKALSDNYYWIQAYTSPGGKPDILVEQTPFAEAVGAENVKIDPSRYFTDVWVSRTCPQTYFAQAIRDGVTAYSYDDAKSSEAISLADFCVIVAKLLDLNGEEVIIDQEAEQLLSVYQRNIPTYITSIQRDAIKYLMVRGIVDGTEDFRSNITGDTALTVMMRAKDKSSRLTFKNIEIPYDKTLLAKGFTGVDMQPENTIADSVQIESVKSATEYYDYLIKKTDATTFKDINGREVTAVYVSANRDDADHENDQGVPGSLYVGEINGYYHFKIPVTAEASATFSSDRLPPNTGKVFTITTRNKDNRPAKYYVQTGGGVYDNFSYTDIGQGKTAVAFRTPFSAIDDINFVDRERKENAQLAMTESDEIKLTANKFKANILIRQSDITKWCDKTISEIKGTENIDGNIVNFDPDTHKLTIEFQDNEQSPYDYISRHLTSDKMSGTDSNGCYPSYIIGSESVPIVLLSKGFLTNNRNGLPNRLTDIQKLSETEYQIDTEGGPIMVNLETKSFATGSSYTELGAEDPSPLITTTPDGDYYIDYRVITSCTAGYMIFDNSDSTKTFVPVDVHDTPVDMPTLENIKSLTGTDEYSLVTGALIHTESGAKHMMLEGPYAKSNFMLYKLNRQGLKGDYLLVFRPNLGYDDQNKRDAIKTKLQDIFKVSLGDNVSCSIYNLNKSVRPADADVISTLSTNVTKKEGYGYLYRIPDITNFDVDSYYKGIQDNGSALPIVQYNGSLYDVNVNHVAGFEAYEVPANLLTSELSTLTNGSDLVFTHGFSTTGQKKPFNGSTPMTPAPIGLTACYRDEFDKTVEELMQMSNDETYRSLGTAGGVIESVSTSATDYNFNIGGSDGYNYKLTATDKFYFAQGNSSLSSKRARGIYIYKDPDGVGITSLSDLDSAYESSLLDGVLKNIFDWEAFKFIEALKTAEDIATLCYIVLLEIVPRVMLFDFLALGTLAIVADTNYIRWLCDYFIDPYKILSLGLLDVHTIDKYKIWKTCFWACVLLLLLNVQTFTNVLGWFLRGFIGIVNR